MARRSKDEAEETREKILEAAIRLFLADGVSQTTLEKIAKEAGCTRGAVYHHFENKPSILLALMEKTHAPAQQMWDSICAADDTKPLDTLEKLIGEGLIKLFSNRQACDIHSIFIFNCEFVEKMNPIFEPECRYSIQVLDKVTEFTKKAAELGHMRSDITPEAASHMLMAFSLGLISTSLRSPWINYGPIDYRAALNVFFQGLRA